MYTYIYFNMYNIHVYDNKKRNWIFSTNSNFLIPKSMQPVGVKLWYFKIILFDHIKEFIAWKYLRYRKMDCKDIRILKSEFVVKTQFIITRKSIKKAQMKKEGTPRRPTYITNCTIKKSWVLDSWDFPPKNINEITN